MATQDIIPSKVTAVEIGPWKGSMRSVAADQAPLDYLASPSQTPALDLLYIPGINDTGTWKRRGGQTVQFDTLSGGASVTGLLPATWSARCRQIEEFLSDSVTDGIPTICALLSKETMASGLDDGAFANLWWRDRVNSLNRTLCDEYDIVTAYPAPGTIQYYRVIPLWYDSGDGGMTRGISEFARRFLLSGARQFQKTGRQWYSPSFRGTPSRWNGTRALSTSGAVNRLIPSGPFPPTHCGTVTAGAAVTADFQYPDADNANANWTDQAGGTTNIYTRVDEVTADDSDYIKTSTTGASCRLRLSDFSTTPATGDTVTIRFRARLAAAVLGSSVSVSLRNGAGSSTYATKASGSLSSTWTDFSYTLTDAEFATVTLWTDTAFTVIATIPLAATVEVSSLRLQNLPAAATSEGGWKGKDRFLRAFYYRFEDGSIWALTTPRFANSTLMNGLDVVTVDSANPEVAYTSITHTNIPIPPAGVVKVGICRGTKIDSTVDDNLVLNPKDFRLIQEVDAGTTSYVDYAGDDLSLGLDVTGLFIRYNHMMPPATRYLAAGDMRVAAAYGKPNPSAIVIAPVGRTADYDLNLAETSSSLYAQNSSYMRLTLSTAGVMTLTLLSDTGAVTTSNAYTSTNYPTLQALVDVINATSCAVDGMQWRAQILPDVSPDAATTSLCPHTRGIASVTTTSGAATLTKAAGGLSKVAVGAYITAAGVTAGTYVTRIDSDTQLTMSANASASAAVTCTFYFRLGDDPTSLSDTGYQRVLGNCLPGFLYFTKTYLATFPTEKSTTWMTVATPGSVKSAPNAWANEEANRFEPPLESGIAQGVAAVDHGFVVPYANKVGAIRPRGPDLVQDCDYSLVIINENLGCCAWNTVTAGNHFATFLATSGLCAADLREVIRFSEDIYAPPTSGVGVVGTLLGTGDFGYEIAASVAATGQDNDASYASVRVIHSIVWVCYRASSSSSTAANRMLGYDFSSGHDTNGLKALSRDNRTRWGWSLPLSRTVSVVGFGRRDDGGHLYGWNDANAGTGAGRVDEIETGDTDNGTAISTGTAATAWIKAAEGEDIVVHRVVLEHNSPSGSTGSLVWHRGYSNDAYSLTPGTSSLDLLSELIQISTPGRTPCNAGYFEYKQASGTAREWRKIKVFIERRRRLR